MRNKRGIEFSFAWMFSIFVGAVILFLAIFATTRLIGTEKAISEAEVAQQLGILLNPVETSIESGKISKIGFAADTRIFNTCREVGNFGSQKISTATRSDIGEEWGSPGVPSTFFNKYIFSSEIVEGKEVFVLAKPLEMPFKVADLLIIWSDKEFYCFVSPPSDIEEEIEDLKPKNVNVSDFVENCPRGYREVCFAREGCDIDVSLSFNTVTKNGESVTYFGDSLLYAAIFADPEIYECQLKRLTKRISELALLYKAKAETLAFKGCSSNLESDLSLYSTGAAALEDSSDLAGVVSLSDSLGRRNEFLSCKLF